MSQQGETQGILAAQAEGSGLWTGTGATSAVCGVSGLRSGARSGDRASFGTWGLVPAPEPDGKHRTCWADQAQLQVEEGPLLTTSSPQGGVRECGEAFWV